MIVGTAGHIDHGKTSLVRVLTGVDTDRLKEEKARGISIDLGFAYLPAGEGLTIGFVDVPGHERFVHNMLAGATGIDFVLLVVAADDGIMPQTVEHLAIVDLLGIEHGLVALTKSDLVDAERLAEVQTEIANTLLTTGLSGADIVPVSSTTEIGIEALRQQLFDAAAQFGARNAKGRFRLAVDRSFTLQGTGTVVTGTVLSGKVAVGDRVLISPSGLPARVRSLHAQNRAAETGQAGDRCALNLVGDGISKDAIARGQVVLDPELHAPADRIDATLAGARLRAETGRAMDAGAAPSRRRRSWRAHRVAWRRPDRARRRGIRATGSGSADRRRGRRPLCRSRHQRPAHHRRRPAARSAGAGAPAPHAGAPRATCRARDVRSRAGDHHAARSAAQIRRPHRLCA